MPAHRETQQLPYTPTQLFEMVAAIECYPEFLPWCKAARIVECKGEGDVLAEMVIRYKQFSERYTSRVEMTPPHGHHKGVIHVEMVEGPFEFLTNHWEFKPHDGGTQVEFMVDFRFKSRMLEMMMGGFFTKAAGAMGEAFRARADELYGKD